MINPDNITNYHLSEAELEEVLAFWVLAANKTAATVAAGLEKLLLTINPARDLTPFAAIRSQRQEELPHQLKAAGIGQYNQKSKYLWALAHSNLDLKNCTVDELEAIPGIGMKTSRCYIMHSRKNAQVAGLDTHILKYLKSIGHRVPKSTPPRKEYLRLEKLFVADAKKYGRTVAEHDLEIWKSYSKKNIQ